MIFFNGPILHSFKVSSRRETYHISFYLPSFSSSPFFSLSTDTILLRKREQNKWSLLSRVFSHRRITCFVRPHALSIDHPTSMTTARVLSVSSSMSSRQYHTDSCMSRRSSDRGRRNRLQTAIGTSVIPDPFHSHIITEYASINYW